MEQRLFILFCIIFAIGSQMNAQVFHTNTLASSHDIALSYNHEEYTQKTLTYNDSISIVLTREYPSKRATFCAIRRGRTVESDDVYCTDIDTFFHVNDFDILGERLYFCGDVYYNGSQTAFIAYFDVDSLFPQLPSITIPPSIIPRTASGDDITYTLFKDIDQDSIYTINRIEAYYGTDGKLPIIAAIGKMYYGEPRCLRLSPDVEGLYVHDPTNYFLDFFMTYTVNEGNVVTNAYDMALDSTLAPFYATANSTKIYYIASDLADSTYYNKFMDIAQTDDDIYIVSADFSGTPENLPHVHFVRMNLMKCPKNTSSPMETYRITTSFDVDINYGLKLTNIGNEYLAMAFVRCDHDPIIAIDTTRACVFKIDILSDTVSIVQGLNFDLQSDKAYIRDIKYLPKSKELIVLKKSIFNGLHRDVVFHLDTEPSVTYPYNSMKYLINNYVNNAVLWWNNIVVSNGNNYTVSGCQTKYLIFFNRYWNFASQTECITEQDFVVEELPKTLIDVGETLQICEYLVLSPVIINDFELFIWYSDTDMYDAIIEHKELDSIYTSQSRQDCAADN